MKHLLLMLPALLLAAACEQGPTIEIPRNEFECTKSHKQRVTTYMLSGKVMIPVTSYHNVCDQYTRYSTSYEK